MRVAAVESSNMTLPREVIPGRFYMITRRCTQRQFLLRPDEDTNNAFIYCLALAAERCAIDVLLPCAMVNHHHTVVYDRHGNIPKFTEHFHKLLAKCQNALRGRWENFWATEQVCMVQLVDPIDVRRKLVYAATNPVKDRLVEKVHHWPGVNGLSALLKGEPLRATRPRYFFRRDGSTPRDVTLTLTIPTELGDPQSFLDELRADVRSVEENIASERRRSGAGVLGRRTILRQSWRDRPTSREERRGLRPTVAAVNRWARAEAILRNREFVRAYREARARWVAGHVASFPRGTYWLRHHARVPLSDSAEHRPGDNLRARALELA